MYVGAVKVVPVLEPSTSNICILLVAYDIEILHLLFGFFEEVQRRSSRTHEDDLHPLLRAHWLLTDMVSMLICLRRQLISNANIFIGQVTRSRI